MIAKYNGTHEDNLAYSAVKLVLNDIFEFNIHHNAITFKLEDPWNSHTKILMAPRQTAEHDEWKPIAAFYDRIADEYVVLLRQVTTGDLREWIYNTKGKFKQQSYASARSLAEILFEFPEYATLETAEILFKEGLTSRARRLVLNIGRKKSLDDRALSLLSLIHNRLGRINTEAFYIARIQKKNYGRLNTITHRPNRGNAAEVSAAGQKRIIYLVQSADEISQELEAALISPHSDFLCLTYKNESTRPRYIFRPRTSWTEGRNALWETALSAFSQFEYLVFLDDDIAFKGISLGEGISKFSEWLLEARPEIGVCSTPWHGTWGLSTEGRTTIGIRGYDALLNAFRRDVIDDRILFPYIECFDDQSWHASQGILIQLSFVLYCAQQLNDLVVYGQENRPYPRHRLPIDQLLGLVTLLIGSKSENAAPNGEEPAVWRKFRRKYFNRSLRDAIYKCKIY